MIQSKLSYPLKILLDSELIVKEIKDKWICYDFNDAEVNNFLSEELCCKQEMAAVVIVLHYQLKN